MLSLTKKSDYALVALTHLARERERVSSAREIAAVYHVPLAILMNILKTLTRCGIVTSVRGARGGYRLDKPPESISLYEIIEAIEGPVTLFDCARSGSGKKNAGCSKAHWCPITAPARKVSDRLQTFLEAVTLAEIASGDETTMCTIAI